MANFISGIISLTIGVVVLANVFISTIKSTNTGDQNTSANYDCATLDNCTAPAWSTAEVALWGLLSLIGIAGIIYGVMNVFGMAWKNITREVT